ncbi:MAG: hypothetical protein J6I96_06595 [Oscillospiraceae bacterium]|nr:hypothetical protein [Oscillospiraceae bacterium]
MSDLTEIKKISDATGATFSDAKEAYYAANGNYALAVSNISHGSYNYGQKVNSSEPSWFENFLASELTVFSRPDKGVSLPLILAAVIGVVCIEFIIPVLIIAFLAGVGFKLSGPVFKKDVVLARREVSQPTGASQEKAYDYRSSYDYKAEFEKQEARRRAEEAVRRAKAESVKYEMPPKYDYDYAYTSGKEAERTGEEKGFF